MSAGESQHSDEVCSFFRKPTKNKNIRKRATLASDDDDEDGENDLPSIQKPRKTLAAADNKLRFSTSRPQSKPAQQESDHDDHHQRPAAFHFESSKLIQVQHDSRATATLETETEFDRDHRAIRERMLKKAEEDLKKGVGTSGSNKGGDGKEYKGIHGYTDYKAGFRREQTVAGEKAGGAHGPLRASAHIRASVRFDYQPDICKDYKETGYCGFGDACKFMHDRGDYKSGWQMEREWEESEKVRKRGLAMGGGDDSDQEADDGDDDDDDLPFACFICRKPFEDPVMTNCKHYFCEHCALKHHSKNKKCYVCNKPTLGIFNAAHDIRKRMAEKK